MACGASGVHGAYQINPAMQEMLQEKDGVTVHLHSLKVLDIVFEIRLRRYLPTTQNVKVSTLKIVFVNNKD